MENTNPSGSNLEEQLCQKDLGLQFSFHCTPSCDNFDLFVNTFHNIYKSSMPSSLISTFVARMSRAQVHVRFYSGKFFNAAPSLHVHVITLIQFVCHFYIGCMKSIFSFSSSISSSLISTFLFKFKFIFIQRKLIFSIPSQDIKLM